VKRLHAHLCHQPVATNHPVNGGDVSTLRQIPGHTTLEMVKLYVNLGWAHPNRRRLSQLCAAPPLGLSCLGLDALLG
jgi:hypothetical protein